MSKNLLGSKKNLLMLIAIALIGILLVGVALPGGDGEVEAAEEKGGIEAITIERKCQFAEFEGVVYFRCGDGYGGKVADPLAE